MKAGAGLLWAEPECAREAKKAALRVRDKYMMQSGPALSPSAEGETGPLFEAELAAKRSPRKASNTGKQRKVTPATPEQYAMTTDPVNKDRDPYSHIYSTPGSPTSFVHLQVGVRQHQVKTVTEIAEYYQLPGGVPQVLQLLIKEYVSQPPPHDCLTYVAGR